MVERLLLTGADTTLGANLALALSQRCEVLGLWSGQSVQSASFRTARWDQDNRGELAQLVRDWQPQWILHCGALARSSWDAAPDPLAAEAEPALAAHIAKLASEMGVSRLTVISSDVVFAGPRMFHDEQSPAESPLAWAQQVRKMERALASSEALVVRTHAYGWSWSGDEPSLAEQVIQALPTGEAIVANGRQHATPILATDLAELLWRAFEIRLQGLYHLAGAERTSSQRFACELASVLGAESPLRMECPPNVAGWQLETSLNSKRARRLLEMPTPLLCEGLQRFVEQSQDGWRERIQFGAAPRLQEAAA